MILPENRTLMTWGTGVLLLCLIAVAGCQSLRVERAMVSGTGDWLTEGDSPQRRHAVDVAFDAPLERIWEYNAGGGFGPASPLLLGSAVLVATRKGEVHAVRLADGKRLGQTEFGEAIEGSPAIAGGTLYVPVDWGRRALQAYDLVEGKSRWKRRTAPIEAGLLLYEGLVIAGDRDGYVRAYTRQAGDEVWAHQLGPGAGIIATPVLTPDGTLVAADDAGRIAAFDPRTGGVRWTQRVPAPVRATPAVGDDALYVATTRGKLYRLDAATGGTQWSFALPDTTVYLGPPALADGLVALGASDGNLRAFDPATGALRWERPLEGAIVAAPLLTQRTLFVGTMQGRLYALDRSTGEVRWSETLDGRIKSPMAWKDGALVVLAEPRTVTLFRQAAPDHATTD